MTNNALTSCRRFSLMLALLFSPLVASAQAGPARPWNQWGKVWASAFGQWSVASLTAVPTPGTYTLQLDSSDPSVIAGGPQIQPFAANAPLLIGSGVSQETVSPTFVGCSWAPGICTVTVTLAKTHTLPFDVRSGTGGLQEAINYLSAQGGTVAVDPSWSGTTAMITIAAGSAKVQIEDDRAGAAVWYGWNGSIYTAAIAVNDPAPGVNATGIEGISYADQFPGTGTAGKIQAAVNSLGSSPGIVVAPPGMPLCSPNGAGFCPFTLGQNQLAWLQNGTSSTSPSGMQITQGGPGQALTNNTMLNLAQFSASPGTVPQNTLYLQQNTSGNLSGNTQLANWALFSAGQVSNVTSSAAFQEEDGTESEASATGRGTPTSFRLVGLGAQDWVGHMASDSITIPYAYSMYARAPFLAGSGGTSSIQVAYSFQADEPFVGTSDNAAIVYSSQRKQDPAKLEIQTTGTTVWNLLTNNFSGAQTDDLWLLGAASPGVSANIYVSHGGFHGSTASSAPLYLNSGGTAAVVVNGMPTAPNFGAVTLGTGGLAVDNGGPQGSLAPVAASGIIRLPNAQTVEFRNAANTTDIGAIGVDSGNRIDIGAGATAINLEAPLSSPLPVSLGGTGQNSTATFPTSGTVAVTSQLPGDGNITTTSGSTDAVIISWPDGGSRTPGHCALAATNSSAASNIATTYVSAKSLNTITLTHATTSGMTYDVVCTVK